MINIKPKKINKSGKKFWIKKYKELKKENKVFDMLSFDEFYNFIFNCDKFWDVIKDEILLSKYGDLSIVYHDPKYLKRIKYGQDYWDSYVLTLKQADIVNPDVDNLEVINFILENKKIWLKLNNLLNNLEVSKVEIK